MSPEITVLKSYKLQTVRNRFQPDFADSSLRSLLSSSKMLRTASRSLRAAISVRSATSKAHPFTRVPLNQVLPGFEKSEASSDTNPVLAKKRDPFDAELSTLENGLKVASQPVHGDFVTIGVAIDSGCRYEAEHKKGISHLVEKLAFASTPRRSADEIFQALDKSSAMIDCQSTRDTTIFAASCHRSGVEEILEIIADAALRPSLLDEEIKAAKETIMHENEEMRLRIETIEPLMTDWLHQAAFKHNTLGFSKFTKTEEAEGMKREDIIKFLRAHHTPARMTVSGVGVEHEELVGLSRRFFVESSEAPPSGMPSVDASRAQYTGGEVRESADLSRVGAGTPYPLLSHISLGFEGVGFKDEDFVTFCVLQSLLGGGNSFSAGGPGKGMYTRCYVDVLNHHHWMYGCQAFNHSYADAGVFAVHASAPPNGIGYALQIVLDLLLRLPEGAPKEELDRAKTQLKSQLLMNLEVRPVMFEDMARQVMGHGYRRKPWEYMQAIDNVAQADIVRVGNRLLASRPSLVGYGDIQALPTYAELDDAVARRDVKLLNPKNTKKKYFSFQ
ncbi:hypothetical protein PENTCL1PPCAC_25021 [Pristionchus entomophagus]|uniref:Mitochondrial-processing peptidase subunit alpha n=1 Tax=Pristionchus entomophagus TaxID=358040 RepID=A0AAV5U8W6_9BILA|nr:hypothetical protein PENTCL1PPCAC_25021 [Pristionchus entomophagus]